MNYNPKNSSLVTFEWVNREDQVEEVRRLFFGVCPVPGHRFGISEF